MKWYEVIFYGNSDITVTCHDKDPKWYAPNVTLSRKITVRVTADSKKEAIAKAKDEYIQYYFDKDIKVVRKELLKNLIKLQIEKPNVKKS